MGFELECGVSIRVTLQLRLAGGYVCMYVCMYVCTCVSGVGCKAMLISTTVWCCDTHAHTDADAYTDTCTCIIYTYT